MRFLTGLILILSCFTLISGKSSAQNYNWITPGKTYLKMYVTEDGLFRINKSDFNSAGIDVTDIDPRTIKVLNLGQQIPIYFSGEQDGKFNNNDYFDFYGTRKYGGLTNTYTETNAVFYVTNEYYDLYSDTNFYWIDWGGSNGLRYSSTDYTSSELFQNNFFNGKLHFESDKYYSQGENFSAAEYRYLSTEKFKGEGWYWKLIGDNQQLSDTFSLPVLFPLPQTASIKLFAYPTVRNTLILNEHNLQIRINGTLISTLISNDYSRFDTTISFSSSLLSNISVNNVTITYVPAPGSTGGVHFDFFELQLPNLYKLLDNKFSCSTGVSDTVSKQFNITGYNSLNQVNIYDVRNNYRIPAFSSSNDTLKFTGKSNGKFEIVNSVITKKPVRIRQRSVPDLVSVSNGADYLVIYNSVFSSQAEQLRAYRQTHDNFRSIKAEIEDIYDIFNYGLENPVAVRNFSKYVFENWQLPKLQYICLLGRGSFDPKKNIPSSTYYKNLVPVYGYPNSDGYFANVNTGTFFYYDQIAIGRLPSYTVSEAQTMVDKIIAYENQTSNPEAWWKTFNFITGGGTYAEQQTHQQRSNFEINTYVIPQNIAGNPVKIYRTDTSGSNTYNLSDSVRNSINRGTLFINFRGHAGSHDWEVLLNDPNTLNNGNKLPLILSLTCFTGENSKTDYRGFGERFVYLPGKGAIGFVGTTGWSFGSSGNDFGTYIIQSLKSDTSRRIGNLLKVAGKSMSSDSLSFNTRHTVNCYNLLGDPAATLNLPKHPEFLINNNDYKLSDPAPEVKVPAVLTVFPKNYGLYADSCKIRFHLTKNNITYSVKDTIIRTFRFSDSVKYKFTLDSAGVYRMLVSLDIDNWFNREIEINNTISFAVPTKNFTFIPVSPVDNSLVYKDSVEFSGLNPNLSPGLNNMKVFMQMDTSVKFNSPVLRTFVKNKISGAVTKFKSDLPVLTNNTLYFWRARSAVNNDTTNWSGTQRFVYNNGSGTGDGKMRFINSQISAEISKFSYSQYNEADFDNTEFSGNDIRLSESPVTLIARSYGSNGEEASYFSVGKTNIYIDGGMNTGLNLIKVKKLTGSVLTFKNFKMTSASSSDSLLTFLNSFDTTHFLMLLNAAYVPGGTNLSSAVKSKLRQFGSIYCDSIGIMSYFHSWSFIGYFGASGSDASEAFDPCCRTSPGCVSCDHWSEAVCTKNVVFKKLYGTLTNIIGPAQTWSDFSWTQNIPEGSSLKFDVIGIDRLNIETLLIPDIQTNTFADISKINAVQYPKLKLLAKFSIDTAAGIQSPVMNLIRINYFPATELVLDRNSVIPELTGKSSKERSSSGFSFDYYNSGFAYLNGVIVNVFNKSVNDTNILFSDTVFSILKTDSMKNYSAIFKKPLFTDSTRIIIQIKPKDDPNEFFSYNNFAEYSLTATGKIRNNISAEVLSDGKKLNSGDNVRKNPELKIILYGDNNLSLESDTTQLVLRLNDSYIPYFSKGLKNPAVNFADNSDRKSGEGMKSVMFYPELKNGNNRLEIVYRNNYSETDTMVYDVIVSEITGISDLYNFPNPMKNETNFIFNLTSPENSGNLKLKIYSVSGKVIRIIDFPFVAGMNQINWDGKDSDGDIVANGTYLYKVVVENGSEFESEVQKLVVLK